MDLLGDGELAFGNEQSIALPRYVIEPGFRDYDIAPGDSRMLMVHAVAPSDPTTRVPQRIHVVLNWHEELKARVPD